MKIVEKSLEWILSHSTTSLIFSISDDNVFSISPPIMYPVFLISYYQCLKITEKYLEWILSYSTRLTFLFSDDNVFIISPLIMYPILSIIISYQHCFKIAENPWNEFCHTLPGSNVPANFFNFRWQCVHHFPSHHVSGLSISYLDWHRAAPDIIKNFWQPDGRSCSICTVFTL